VLLNQLITEATPLDNILYFERKVPDSEDEELASDASALENRHTQNADLRREYRERLKRKYNLDPDNSEDEKKLVAIEKSVVKDFKKRKLDRDEYNEMVGVQDHGASSSVSPMSEDSDYKELRQDDLDFIKKKEDEYREENSHKEGYSEEDANKYAKICLDKIKEKLDNPETDHSETDNPETDHSETDHTETNHEHEGGYEADSEDESSSSDNGSDKGTNISTKIRDLIRKSGGSGGESSGGSGGFAGGSNNNGGSDNGSSNFSIISRFILILFSIIEVLAETINNLFL